MKLKIKPYVQSLIKDNAMYLALTGILAIVLTIFIPVNIQKILANTQKIDQMADENKELNDKAVFLNTVISDPEELESDIKLLNELIPNAEDYFSMIYTLDKLSKQTGFNIISYALNLKDTNKDKLKLTITGSGDKESFLKFLKEYNFGGGRLITSNRIELSQQLSGQIKIDIMFYHKSIPTEIGSFANLSATALEELRVIKNKINYSIKESSDEAGLNSEYQRKTNPF